MHTKSPHVAARSPRALYGFTLIELLVVITIIVVLLALLTPALDKAIYQAELAVCSGRLKAFGTGVTVYATEFRRHYPHRPWVFTGGRRPNHFWTRNGGQWGQDDERTLIRPYVARMNTQVQCPFNQEMFLDQTASTDPVSESNVVYTSYYLLYDWGYTGEQALRRLGDRFGYDGDRFSILVSDYDMFDLNSYPRLAIGSHPDRGANALMEPYVLEDVSWATFATGVQFTGTIITISRWTTAQKGMRAPLDLNFAHTDGAVARVNNVTFESSPGAPDERMARVIESSNRSGTYYAHMPPDH